MKFYLGTHKIHWLRLTDIPLFISHRWLRIREGLPKAMSGWALDSGGFTELKLNGKWDTTVDEYVEHVLWYQNDIGHLEWAAPMDWMCEPQVRDTTGLSTREHQERTIENYLELEERGPFIPVIQGWELDEYIECVELYNDAGVDLTTFDVVGVGSVCRRQSTKEAELILRTLSEAGINLHGFGVKILGMERYKDALVSADSMAWSFNARYNDGPMIDGHPHVHCGNCLEYAIMWYEDLMERLEN